MEEKNGDIHGLIKVYKMVRNSMRYFADKYQLSVVEMGIVFDVFLHEGLTATQLATMQAIPKSSISRLVEHLVKRNILNRERPENNRRIVHITLSDEFRNEMLLLEKDAVFQQLLEQDMSREDGQKAIGQLMRASIDSDSADTGEV